MIRLYFLILFIVPVHYAVSQVSHEGCEVIYHHAKQLFIENRYDLAIKKITAYKICPESNSKKADELLIQIFEKVNSQRKEAKESKSIAIQQRNVANQRAELIAQQRDSIEKENMANRMAIQALQRNQIDPKMALEIVNLGLCYNPNNVALTEVRRKILSEEIIYKGVEGADPFLTLNIKRCNENTYITSERLGIIKQWDLNNDSMVGTFKIFYSLISGFEVLNDSLIFLYGFDDQKVKPRVTQFKLLNFKTGKLEPILPDSLWQEVKFSALKGDSNSIFLGNEKREIFLFKLSERKVSKYKFLNQTIVGLNALRSVQKPVFGSSKGVYYLDSEKPVYEMKNGINLTSFDVCQRGWDFYLVFGSDMVRYSFFTKEAHFLSSVHKGLITSCHCDDSTSQFLTTSHDGVGVLWSEQGNPIKFLKGNRPELYDGFLLPNSTSAITVGRRQLNGGTNADSNTIKRWYVSNYLMIKSIQADKFGTYAMSYVKSRQIIVSIGNDKGLNIWSENLNLIKTNLLSNKLLSCVTYDSSSNYFAYGTFDGETGIFQLNDTYDLINYLHMNTHVDQVSEVCIIHNMVYSCGRDGAIFLQDFSNNRIDSIYFDVELRAMKPSFNSRQLLLAAGNSVILFDLVSRKKNIFKHLARVNDVAWITNSSFSTVSGQMLRIWNANNTANPSLKADNNIQNELTSVFIDNANKLIYTGSWSGYLIVWNFFGNQIYLLDQLTGLYDNGIINDITGAGTSPFFYTSDYYGRLTKWQSPVYFINSCIKSEIDCSKILQRK